jgi:hypothetical protein
MREYRGNIAVGLEGENSKRVILNIIDRVKKQAILQNKG